MALFVSKPDMKPLVVHISQLRTFTDKILDVTERIKKTALLLILDTGALSDGQQLHLETKHPSSSAYKTSYLATELPTRL